MNKKKNKLLTVKLEGPNVRNGRISIDSFTLLISKIQSCINHFGIILSGKSIGKKVRRHPSDIKKGCMLEIVSLSPGSIEVTFDISSKKEEQALFESPKLGEKAVELMVQTISGFEKEKPTLPPETNVHIVRFLRDISTMTKKEANSIKFLLEKPIFKQAVMTKEVYNNIEKYLLKPYCSATIVEGFLRELDLERNKCQIFPKDNRPFVRCSFVEEIEEEIISALDKYVKVHGEAKIRAEDGTIKILDIKDIEIIPEEEEKLFKEEQGFKCKDLLSSDLVGIWKDRKDIMDTVQFVNEIRKRISQRTNHDTN
jgi:septum formation topological specificity factor MinE